MAAVSNSSLVDIKLESSKSLWISERFDFAISLLAAASFWIPHAGIGTLLIQGIRGFACANLADRVLRQIFLENKESREEPFLQGALHAVIEQGLYAGILQTRSSIWAIPRFATSLFLGATAARTFEPFPSSLVSGISRDQRWGFVWAILREIASCYTPLKYFVPLLIAADSAVSGLCEVCPQKGRPFLPRYNAQWTYKVFSRAIFQAAANLAAVRAGFISAMVQHLLFNFSRSLGSEIRRGNYFLIDS